MGRLFFICPIQALYMMKEFRVKFNEIIYAKDKERGIIREVSAKDDITDRLLGRAKGAAVMGYEDIRVYVAPKSEAIFDPKEGDIGTYEQYGSTYFSIFTEGQWRDLITGAFGNVVDRSEITMRDRKQFFSAKRETTNNN